MTDLSDADATLFAKCLDAVKGVAEEFPDTRKGENCTLTIPDAAMSLSPCSFFSLRRGLPLSVPCKTIRERITLKRSSASDA